MFLEPLESRTLLSSNTLEPTLDFQAATPPSILIPGLIPRDLIFDPTRNQLLSLQNDTVDRYDAFTGALVGSILIDHSLQRGDITPDGKYLYLTDFDHPRVLKVDLDANTYIAIPTPSSANDLSNIRELAVSSGKVFTSEDFYNYSGVQCCNNIRQIDLATDTFSNSSFTNYGALALTKFAYFARNADYSYTALISSQHDYSIVNNTLSGLPNRNYGNIRNIAVSHDGALHAIAGDSAVRIVNSHFDVVTSLGIAAATVAFDPHRDILYATNPTAHELVAFDTNSWNTLFSIPIGQDSYPSKLAVSDDGQSLFLSTFSGIRIFHPGENVQLFHEPLTLTATLALTAVGTPSGVISFIDTDTEQSIGQGDIQDGVATLTLDNFELGSHSILARYGGDELFSAADSAALTFKIQPALSTATIESPGSNQLTVTLNSRAGTPSAGSITIYEGNTPVGTGILSGPLPLNVGLALEPGVHWLRAVYSGDSEHLATVSSRFRHVVRFPTTLTLSAPDEATSPAEAFTLALYLDPSLDASMNSLKIYKDSQFAGFPRFDTPGVAHFSFNNLTVGLHHFSASFDGTELLEPSVSNEISHEVILRPVTVSLTAPPKATQFDTLLMFSVQAVNGAVIPRGQVTFMEAGQVLASAGEISSDGRAAFGGADISVGVHTITATYTSTNGFASATTDPVTIEVLPNSTSITLSTSTNWFLAKQPVLFHATLTNYPMTGQVIFRDGSRTIGTSSLNDGSVEFSWAPSAGVHKISAYFAGNASFLPATSATLKITVAPVTTIDLMVLYTPAATHSIGSAFAIRKRITDSVADTNLAFLNSHIPVALHLVHSQQIAYKESGKLDTDLTRLTRTSDGFMDNIHRIRNQVGADLVTLLESNGDFGGTAIELRNLHAGDNPARGFSVVLAGEAGAPYYTLAHELGHNLGATHDAGNNEGRHGATSYSNGWRFRGKDGVLYHDIMSYDPGQTIPYFSNPRIKYQGVPIGNAKSADSARTITLTAPYVAAYRRRAPST